MSVSSAVTDASDVPHARALLDDGLICQKAGEELTSAALGHFTTEGNQWRRVDCLRLLGDLRVRRDEPAIARNLYEAALCLAQEIGAKSEQQKLNSRLAGLRRDPPAGEP